MTIETTPLLTEADARRLTLRIGLLLDSAAGVLDNLSAAIREARDRRADLALGYESWAEYATAEFGDRTAGLAPAIRRELVASLSVEVDGSPALSTRQIAPAVGVSQMQAVRDVRAAQVKPDVSPGPTRVVDRDVDTSESIAAPLVTPPPFDPAAGEVLDEAAPRPAVLGLDGKTYTRPAPKPPTVDPKKGTDLYALRMAIIPALDAWTDQWSTKPLLDDSVTAEEAAQVLRDLSRLTPVLSQIRRLLTSRTEPTK
ncbi:hypothetical protein QUV83_16180 [Cellulomonas cellasea]|uniref:hypothetical protein n=1 Tax=Cellulomonas cellasea TaxID=43670 RepID=UPI0025A3B959|nr:hypothetical protein [Cellulomonas cellasea]MDM8086313.1 hypothetical protein [Cellulomonas cellasea]